MRRLTTGGQIANLPHRTIMLATSLAGDKIACPTGLRSFRLRRIERSETRLPQKVLRQVVPGRSAAPRGGELRPRSRLIGVW